VLRVLTSTARWILSFLDWPVRVGHALLLSPPWLPVVVIFMPSSKPKLQTIRSGSYQDWATIHEIFIRSEYSLKPFSQWHSISRFYRELADAGNPMLILDIGANVGVSARYFASEYPAASIACLEPSSENYLKLRANISGLEQIWAYEAAISSAGGVVDLFDPNLGNNAFRTFGKGKPVSSVPAMTVAQVLDDFSNYELFIVKVDIEGFESELFESNYEWIDRAKVISIETHDWMFPGEGVSRNFIKALGDRKRDLVFKGENLFSIRID